MSCESEIVLKIENISKCFEMYDKPAHRLFQTLCAGKKNFYKEFWALKNVNLEIAKGECFGILGRNGAGKSTLLQIITGILLPTTGSVTVAGRIAALLELGSGFNPEFTGRENVYMSASILGLSKREIDIKFQEIIDFADIGEFIDQSVKTYSSGMMLRLAFAVNVVVEPEILIIDEALAVGDVAFQAKCLKRIQNLLEKGTTIIFVTHDLSSVIQYCTKACIIDDGKLIAVGEPLEMVDKYNIMMAQLVTSIQLSEPGEAQRENTFEDSLPISEHCLEYGDLKAKIVAYRIFNMEGNLTTELLGNQTYCLQIDLNAAEKIDNPIVAYTFRDVSGTIIFGTNTLAEKANIPVWQQGSSHRVEFRFVPSLQSNSYFLLLGCTQYINGGLAVHHRLFEVCTLNIKHPKLFNGLVYIPTKIDYYLLR